MIDFEQDFKESTFHKTHETPNPLIVTNKPYPKEFTHNFNIHYGLDVLAQEFHEQLDQLKSRVSRIEKFIDGRLQFYKDKDQIFFKDGDNESNEKNEKNP